MRWSAATRGGTITDDGEVRSDPRTAMSRAATQRRRALHAFYKDHEPTWTDAELTEATKRQISLYGGSERQFSELIQKLTTRYGVSPTKTERPARSLSKSRFHRTASLQLPHTGALAR